MKPQDFNISSEKLKFRSKDVTLHDTKLETKPVSYFKDALYRFTKNKASIVAAFIIAILIIFAIVVCLSIVCSSDCGFWTNTGLGRVAPTNAPPANPPNKNGKKNCLSPLL